MKRVIIASVAVLALALTNVNPALAWSPKADIVKKVQNLTSKSELVDANDSASAVAAKPGDILKYVIEVKNAAPAHSEGHNDLAFTVMTDNLPAGVELASDASKRKIAENLGTIKPGQKVVKEYQVKVTSKTDGSVITNEACVDGDSSIKDHPQHDCDKAVVKVSVPPVKEDNPKEEPKKEVLAAATEIPATGPEAIAASTISLGALGYGASAYLRSKRIVRNAYKR